MNKLYIDITQLVNWSGKLTGIPRVMYELSSRYAMGESTTFVVWNDAAGGYEEVDGDILDLDKTSEQNTVLDAGSIHRSHIARLMPKPAKKIAKKIIRREFSLDGPKLCSLKQDDTLLVMWGEWSNQKFIDYLVEQKNRGVNLIQIVYDMLPILTPQFSGHATVSLTNYAKAIYPLCSALLSISENTKNDVSDWLKTQKLRVPNIHVFRLGDDFSVSTMFEPKRYGIEKGKFILMVGTIEARKNHMLMYYVYKLAKQRRIELPNLVVVGRVGWRGEDSVELISNDPETKDRIILVHDGSDEELSWLYSNCTFSIYPSLYEGWGLPISESLGRGVPCVSSNTSSMTEISDKGVIYFSPTSTDECLNSITEMLNKDTFKKLKNEASQYKQTEWDITFSQVDKYVGRYT
jgi:glycosyltransferase involved in cell wall biosynthesis